MSWSFTHRTNPNLDTWADKPDYSKDGHWYNMDTDDINPVSQKTYKKTVVDPVAGVIKPDANGACDYFIGDGRSDICYKCDWPQQAHYRDEFSMSLRQSLVDAAMEIHKPAPKKWWIRLFRR